MRPHWHHNDDATKLIVDIPTTPPSRFELDADELDDFIANLADMRTAMTPSVPLEADPDPGSRVAVAKHGRWWVQPLGPEGAAICVLHPGYRWVGLALDPDAMRSLADMLLRNLPSR